MMLLPQFATPRADDDIEHLIDQIHHCDALDLLRRLPDESVDMVLCDLPYGVTACKWDTVIPIEPMWEQLKRIVKPHSAIVLTATQPFTSRLVSSNYEMFKYSAVWNKKYSGNFMIAAKQLMITHEDILIFSKRTPNYYPIMEKRKAPIKGGGMSLSNVFNNKMIALNKTYDNKYPVSILNFPRDLGRTTHPTQKPVALFEYLIKTYTREGEIVLDMTCGSGTTAVAARKTNRRFICGDITQEYVDIARKRLQDTDPYQPTVHEDGTKQLSLFEGLSA